MKNKFFRDVSEKVKENESIKECDKMFSLYWQNIVLVATLIIFILFIGKYIIENKILSGNDSVLKTIANVGYGADKEVVSDEEKNTTVKRAYLTFDDGPSNQTGEILDILAENDVQATFFVIGRSEEYYDMYRRIVDEGHTLALHSYSHDYSQIYASEEEFINDIEDLRNLLYDVTGVNCTYYRFPGGSTNTVSNVSMDSLIEYLDSEGITYFDWNALNEDAVVANQTPEQLVENVLRDALKYDDTIILMHDLDARHETVESLQMLIDRLKEEGYELLPIDENTPLIRYR